MLRNKMQDQGQHVLDYAYQPSLSRQQLGAKGSGRNIMMPTDFSVG
jgi:hypothetical protein